MAEFDVPFSPPTFDVSRLAQESALDGETVIGVKLTDECLTALTAAHKRKTRLKLVVDEHGGGTVHIGDTSFRFSTQSLPTPFADAVSCQPGVGFTAKASVGLKYTIQATQNSFEETRVKAQKMMEEEKSRGTKDVNKSRNGKKTEVGRGLSGSHASAALAHVRASTLAVNKQTATTVLGGGNNSRNASPNLSSSASAAAAQAARLTVPYRADLMKKSLRERVIHIVITARYKSFDEVIGRLRKDGLPSEQDSRKGIEELLKEVSEPSDSGRVCLKPCFYPEVNLKWKWLSTEEMNYIRKLQNPQNISTSSFAPSRKSGVDRVMAPSATINSSMNTSTPSSASSDRGRENDLSRSSGSSSASNTSSPEAIADRTPPKGQSNGLNGLNGTKKRSASPIMNDDSKEVKEDEDDYYPSTASSSKRKAHAPSMTSLSKTTPSPQMNTSLSSRPVRQESASPPEDPTMGKEESRGKSSKMTSVSPHPPPSSTSLPPPSSSSSRAPSTSPRTDWNAVYGVITSNTEADNYIHAFTTCYTEYAEMHSKLSKIADEFTGMEKELKGCSRGSNEAKEMEAKIQLKYSHYEKDVDFIKLRNRHSDLRSKLTIIRTRLDSWESRRL